MTTYTANDIIAGALRNVSGVTPGEAIVGDEASNALFILNGMLAEWSTQEFLIPFRTIESFTLTVGKQSYTIGQSGSPDFNTVRPDRITDWWITDVPNAFDYTNTDFYTQEQYDAIALKNTQGIPRWLTYDPQYPNGVIYLYPTAVLATYKINIQSKKPIMQFALLTSQMILPAEYFQTIKLLLTEQLAPEYTFEIEQGSTLYRNIERARKFMKRKNTRDVVATFDAALTRKRVGNIFNGFQEG